MNKLDRNIRGILLRVRVLPNPGHSVIKPDSPEYLFLVQQAKRISLSKTIGRFSRWNFLIWPWLIIVAGMKWLDLALSNTIIRSFINEMDLQKVIAEPGSRAPAVDLKRAAERPSTAGRLN